MAIDKRLQVFDAEGNPVDYDILATDVKFNDGEDLPTKLAELEEEIGEGGYNPPEGGIPATDLAPAVQTSLGKADTAYQKPASGIPASDIAAGTIPDVDGLATKTELNTGLAEKVDKETGKGLSANDYTTAEKNKLAGIQSGAEVNPTFATINGNRIDQGGNIQVVGTQGPKGDTGNVQVDGIGNVLIVNNLDDGGTGAALSAEMGKRLALKVGTYAGAWARSKAVIVPFCWLWQETVGGAAICKPIWHIGNSVFVDAAGGVVSVQAAAIPAAPTFSETSGSTVGKGTELTITPDVDSALYYKIGNGNWIVSDTAVTIEITATTTITAKCVNNYGSSSELTCSLTVSGPQAPSFAAAQGTTIATGDVVSRGGSVVVSVPQGGELHYSTDGTNYTTASGLSVTIPVPAAGVHIYAYNVQDNDQSAVVDHDYTMAALAAPSMSPAGGQLPAGGGTVGITGPAGASIYYTLDGSTPTDQSTLYNDNQPISVTTNNTTIKAIAKDDYGYSEVTTETYTVAVDHKLQFKIKLTGDNSTEYFPVTQNNSPLYHFTIDWGDGTTDTVGSASNPVYKTKKSVSHQYTGTAGTEFTVTVRGTALPILDFSDNDLWNRAALYKILENSLTCDSQILLSGCSNLAEISADAFQNNTRTSAGLGGTALTSIPDGLLSHLTKSGVALTSCHGFFKNSAITITASQMNELKAVIGAVTTFTNMFYSFTGSATIPDDFFDMVANDSVTDVSNMCAPRYGTKCLVVGNAETLYNVLKNKVTSSAATSNALVCDSVYPSGNSRSNVPSSWGGSGS